VPFQEGDRVQGNLLQEGQVETLRGKLDDQQILLLGEDEGRDVDVERSSLRRFLICPR
jgi:hypothetical protein